VSFSLPTRGTKSSSFGERAWRRHEVLLEIYGFIVTRLFDRRRFLSYTRGGAAIIGARTLVLFGIPASGTKPSPFGDRMLKRSKARAPKNLLKKTRNRTMTLQRARRACRKGGGREVLETCHGPVPRHFIFLDGNPVRFARGPGGFYEARP